MVCRYCIGSVSAGSNGDLVKQVRTPPVRPADGVVVGVYESFVPGGASLDGEGDTVVLFSQGGAGENDIRLDCFFEG